MELLANINMTSRQKQQQQQQKLNIRNKKKIILENQFKVWK